MLRVQDLDVTELKSKLLPSASSATFLSRSHRWVPLAIFAASLLVTVTFWRVLPSSFRMNEGSDYFAYYEPLARNLLAGRGLTLEGNPDISHPPGYSLALAGVFKISQALQVNEAHSLAAFVALCMALVSVLVFFLARIMWGMWPAIISAILWITYPFALWLTKQPNSELPFMVVFYVGLLLFWYAVARRIEAWPLYAICGFLFGLAMLIRPFAIGIGLTMAITVWLVKPHLAKRSRLLLMLALLIGNTAAVLPWEIWAYAQTGKVILLGTGGAGGIRDGLTFGADRKDYREEKTFSPDVSHTMSDFRESLKGAESLREVVGVIATETRAHPLGIAKLFLLKVARSWYGTDSLRKEGWILLLQLTYLFPFIWCVRKVWRQGDMARRFALGVLMMVMYFWAMSVIGTSLLRYTVPITGLVFVLMSGAFSASRAKPSTA
jgi:4-amino-4-deoxy-L-arabinose transferase-like glycosyltransferase